MEKQVLQGAIVDQRASHRPKDKLICRDCLKPKNAQYESKINRRFDSWKHCLSMGEQTPKIYLNGSKALSRETRLFQKFQLN